jgi:hypothetical protein
MSNWSFLTKHGQVLVCISRNPDIRLRDIAQTLDVTERHAHGVINDLVDAGYIVKEKDGRRNRYQVQTHLPLPDTTSRQHALGEVLDLLGGPDEPTTDEASGAA